MKKILIAGFIFFLLLFTPRLIKAALIDIKNPQISKPEKPKLAKIEKKSWIFADSDYSQATVNFSPRETVYLKIEIDNDGEKQRTVKLLDSEKKTINIFDLQREGSNPFIFKQSFPTPDKEGVYYLHLDIIGSEGSTYVAESNINVGGTNGRAESVAVADVKAGTSGETETVTETLTEQEITEQFPQEREATTAAGNLSPTPDIHQKEASGVQEILKAYQNLYINFFRNLTNFFKNLFSF